MGLYRTVSEQNGDLIQSKIGKFSHSSVFNVAGFPLELGIGAGVN